MHKLEVLAQLSTPSTRPRTSPQSRAISTGSDPGVTQVDPSTNSSAKHGISRIIYGIDSPYDIKPFAHIFGHPTTRVEGARTLSK